MDWNIKVYGYMVNHYKDLLALRYPFEYRFGSTRPPKEKSMTTYNIKSSVLAALQSAEGEDGPDGLDYIRLMGELAVICSSRAQECAKRMESESAGRPKTKVNFRWEILLRRTTTHYQEKSVEIFAATKEEAEELARSKGLAEEFWDYIADKGHTYSPPMVVGSVREIVG